MLTDVAAPCLTLAAIKTARCGKILLNIQRNEPHPHGAAPNLATAPREQPLPAEAAGTGHHEGLIALWLWSMSAPIVCSLWWLASAWMQRLRVRGLASDRAALQTSGERLLFPQPGRQKLGWTYSITSSARARTEGGTTKPSTAALLRLSTSSNLVGCATGKLAGFAPFKILAT